VKIGPSKYKLSEKSERELVKSIPIKAIDLHMYFESFVRIMQKEEKKFGRNQLYDFINIHFGITSPNFSDSLFTYVLNSSSLKR
jgi:hypothetical protein